MLDQIISNLHFARDDKVREYMIKYFNMKASIRCMTCGGYGHVSKGCATKKRVDKITRKTPMRIVWGRFKSDLKMGFMSKKAEVAKELRDTNHQDLRIRAIHRENQRAQIEKEKAEQKKEELAKSQDNFAKKTYSGSDSQSGVGLDSEAGTSKDLRTRTVTGNTNRPGVGTGMNLEG